MDRVPRNIFRYNEVMAAYQFFHPVEVRYGDLDAQQHVNNANYEGIEERGND
jgi:acyl-CoA thioesterase FadM